MIDSVLVQTVSSLAFALIALAGTLIWFVNAVLTFRGTRRRWLLYCWFAGTPVASIALFLAAPVLSEPPPPDSGLLTLSDSQELVFGNAFLGFVTWLALLVLEALLLLFMRIVRRPSETASAA